MQYIQVENRKGMSFQITRSLNSGSVLTTFWLSHYEEVLVFYLEDQRNSIGKKELFFFLNDTIKWYMFII